MSETVWVAIIAVMGTSLGSAISPAINAVRDSTIARVDADDHRVEAAATFTEKLMALALRSPVKFDDPAGAANETLAARFALARQLGRAKAPRTVRGRLDHASAAVLR